jgi:DNA polymerase III subunit epsilon
MLDFFKTKKQAALSLDGERPITETSYVVIDTELTGLNERKDSVISIGAVKMIGTRIDLSRTFHKLIKPETKFKPESVVIHGITPSDVSEKPNIDNIIADFLEFCGDDVLIGHCVSIDLSFINRDMKRIFNSPIRNPVIDTFMIHEWIRKRMPSHACFPPGDKSSGLYEMAKCFDIPVRGAHDALMDAFITAQLFQRFMPVLTDLGIKSIGMLLKIGHPEEGGDRFKTSGEFSNF